MCHFIICRICLEKPSRMEYDVDYVPSIFTYPTKSKELTTHSKLCCYKRLINRRSKVLTTNRRSKKDHQIFVFDSSDVQQRKWRNFEEVGISQQQKGLLKIPLF